MFGGAVVVVKNSVVSGDGAPVVSIVVFVSFDDNTVPIKKIHNEHNKNGDIVTTLIKSSFNLTN